MTTGLILREIVYGAIILATGARLWLVRHNAKLRENALTIGAACLVCAALVFTSTH